MKHLKTEKGSAMVGQSADTFDVSQARWPALERLIQEAESIGSQAEGIIDSLVKSLKDRTIAIACDQQLGNLGFYALVCGEWIPQGFPSDWERAQKRCTLFWTSVRAALYNQFKGFAVPDDKIGEIWSAIREAAVTLDKGEAAANFWSVQNNTNKIGRIWFLVAYAKVLQESAAGARDGQLPIKKLDDVFERVSETLSGLCEKGEAEDLNHWLDSARLLRFDRARRFDVWRLLNRYQGKTFEPDQQAELGVPDDDKLRGAFRSLLTRSTKSAPGVGGLVHGFRLLRGRGEEPALGVEISLLLRILFGRYLNDSLAYTDFEKDQLLREGMRYVLGKQESDGSWELPMPTEAASLFLHRFSPLLHLLDLDTKVLQDERASLVQACRLALDSARRSLSAQEAALQEGLRDPHNLSLKDLVNSVVIGLSLSATIYDRLKDLLSDLILTHRGAVDGNEKQRIEQIPNSLEFRENIKKGVIELWRDHDRRRPGAVLIFGPPGTGKTTVAAIIASELNRKPSGERVGPMGVDLWRFLALRPADFAREGSDRIVACAEQLFGELKRVRRCVVLLDEMEEFLRSRGPGSDRDSRLVTTAFLPLLQEAVEAREIILVIATNFVGSIDVAVTRQGRFDLILPLGPPDDVARKEILERMFKDEYEKVRGFLSGPKLTPEGFEEAVVEYSMGYAPAELDSFFRQLWEKIEPEVHPENPKKITAPKVMANRHNLEIELWRIRADRVPIALSGRGGSDWRTFEDEAKRYHRYAPGREPNTESESYQRYWREPAFPPRRRDEEGE